MAPLPPITPHWLRRTWATLCATIGRDPNRVAAQIGHVNRTFRFSVYQQVGYPPYIDEQSVWTLMRFAEEPAEPHPAAKSLAEARRSEGVGSDR